MYFNPTAKPDPARRKKRPDIRVWLVGACFVLGTAAILIVRFGPAYMRHGMSALLVISRSAEAASPYRIDVRPGNATVPRQSDQAVTARLYGFHGDRATLEVRPAAGGDYQEVPLLATSAGTFEGMLSNIQDWASATLRTLVR